MMDMSRLEPISRSSSGRLASRPNRLAGSVKWLWAHRLVVGLAVAVVAVAALAEEAQLVGRQERMASRLLRWFRARAHKVGAITRLIIGWPARLGQRLSWRMVVALHIKRLFYYVASNSFKVHWTTRVVYVMLNLRSTKTNCWVYLVALASTLNI